MPRYENDWGEEFEDEDEARDYAHDHMSKTDYEEYLGYSISHNALLEWAMTQDKFWENFYEQIQEAEDSYFNDFYHPIPEDEIETEED